MTEPKAKKARRIGYGKFVAADGTTVTERTNARTLVIDGVTYKRQAKEKPLSRAARMSKAVGILNDIASDIRLAMDEEDAEEMKTKAQEAIDRIEFGEVESLKEEMESWRDNLDSANMSHMPKYDEVSECCDNLDSMYGELESMDLEIEDTEDIEDLRSSIESIADSIENAAAMGDDVSFPGMFG